MFEFRNAAEEEFIVQTSIVRKPTKCSISALVAAAVFATAISVSGAAFERAREARTTTPNATAMKATAVKRPAKPGIENTALAECTARGAARI